MNVPWETAVGAELLPGERNWLKIAARVVALRFEQPVIVNIGVWRCASMYCLRAGAPEARIVGVDLRPPVGKVHPDLQAEMLLEDSRTCPFDGPVHLLFVDGDHRYPMVVDDIANWAPKIVSGGIISFHDYTPTPANLKHRPHLAGVKQAVDELVAQGGWEQLQSTNSIVGFVRGLE